MSPDQPITTAGSPMAGRSFPAESGPAFHLDRVLAAVDFAAPSREAAQWTARTFGAECDLVLLNVLDLPEAPPFVGASLPAREQLLESARRGADLRLQELSDTLLGPRTRIELRVGAPAPEIAAAADACAADLIVIGEHGRRTGLSRLFASTAQRVARLTDTAVLLARCPAGGALRRLLVAVDETPGADDVLAFAGGLAVRVEAAVELLYVVDNALVRAVAVAAGESERRRAEQGLRDSACRWLDARASAMRDRRLTVTTCAALGDPAHEIVAEASRSHADLIVVGGHSTRRRAGAFVGRTADRVLRESDRSVLLVSARNPT
jgi:nucleotide-binding universal stress UspA family protein